MIFFKKKSGNSDKKFLIKVYTVIEADNVDEGIKNIINAYQDFCTPKITDFCINYKKEKDIKNLKSSRFLMSDFETLIAFSDDTDFGLDVSLIPSLSQDEKVFRFSFLFNSSWEEADILNKLLLLSSKYFSVIYGYARYLPENQTRVESEKKRSFFGGEYTEIKSFGSDWLCDPTDIFKGGIKGFYPYNIISSEFQDSRLFKECSGLNGFVVEKLNENVLCVKIDSESLSQLKKSNSALRPYVFF